MATQVKKVRIFVASPGDVQSEREQLEKVVSELNLTIAAMLACVANMMAKRCSLWPAHLP